MEISLGALLIFYAPGSSNNVEVAHRFQNFNFGADVTYESNTYTFMPFGFSGVTINRDGAGVESGLILPNTDISRDWAVSGLSFYNSTDDRANPWTAHVQVAVLDGTNIESILHEYWGQITGGSWDEASLNITLGGILDSVGNDFPVRRLTEQYVGALPTSSGVRLQ